MFLMITIGYVARRTVFNISTLRGLNQFVYILAVPALFFNASSQVSIRELLNFLALGASL
jgi:malonate transporter